MVYLFLAIGALVFVICLNRLDVASQMRVVVAATRQAQGIISSAHLTDEAKEVAIQKAAIAMAVSLALILGRLGLCLLIPATTLWLGAQSGAYSTADALAAAANWVFIIASSAIIITAWLAIR
jgi:hypothetical protein